MLEQSGNRHGVRGAEAGGLWGVGAGRESCFFSIKGSGVGRDASCSPVTSVLQDGTPRAATARSASPWSPQHRLSSGPGTGCPVCMRWGRWVSWPGLLGL